MKKYLIILLAMTIMACGGNDNGDGGINVPSTKDQVRLSSKSKQTTPNGAEVYSLNGVTQDDLVKTDEGLTQAFTDGRASGWTRDDVVYDYRRYRIHIPADGCVPSPETHTPSFIVRADNYDGSVFDQYNTKGELPQDQQDGFNKYVKDNIGVIYASEMVLTYLRNAPQDMKAEFIVCQEIIKDGARYGAEHVIASSFDPWYFSLTMVHDRIPHPILPKQNVLVQKNQNKDLLANKESEIKEFFVPVK